MTKNKSARPAKGRVTSPKESLTGSLKPSGVHVIRSPRGGWYVKVDGAASALDRFPTKKDAVTFARSLKAGSFARTTEIRLSGEADIVVHGGLVFHTMTVKSGKVSRPESGQARRSKHRTFGSAKGRIRMAQDFDETPGDFADYIG